ncbi:hypothetical protein CcaverHIS002_0505840 [Cutaneotrichosporon cavernicola]|uniref:RNA polymerase II-associated protein 1 C-terminal domain-containing protein n=1 Tax=Cutaneotrichosporon cavernicola TaxID=279322 RepID=A0AA48L6T3_9TREE|nr:uncharacterized protein CcaverHIS019_0506360 [Cutaneotrichosporon cavernicola]BEI85183.1 hypothetical protein CcaverHIS002_0505840 [Cutaneotrichosporon cavernicola]BEI93008.1 hypothetical protein CcaverHIS019_0506360 [Cutaneotrichosporon cavernicola]BEJ00785.1 hypothetical protein CcaverHIS631_0506420 [Cutaneotrichosporon cavernicola]
MFVKDIVERDAPPPTAPRPPAQQSRGFPTASHRSGGSAFARARKDAKVRAGGGLTVGEGRVVEAVPGVQPSSQETLPSAFQGSSQKADNGEERSAISLPALSAAEQIRRQVHTENLARVQAMSQAERESEADELKERFGTDIVDLMRRRRAARDGARVGPRLVQSQKGMGVFEGGPVERPTRGEVEMGDMGEEAGLERVGGMGGVVDRVGELGAGERAQNTARIAGMSTAERDDEMRDLEERFGAALLGRLKSTLAKRSSPTPKPAEPKHAAKPVHDHPTSDPRPFKSLKAQSKVQPQAESSKAGPSKPKSVRFDAPPTPTELRRYFPDAPANDPKLEWMMNSAAASVQPPPQTEEGEDENATRFDLQGNPLSQEQAAKLPSHLGLHHHGAAPEMAGYTVGEITHLCYSTVASQRVAMMGVLGRVVRNYRRAEAEMKPKPKEEAKEEDGETKKEQGWVADCRDADVEGKALSVSSSILASPTRALSVVSAAIDLLFVSLGGPWPYLDHPPIHFHPDPTRNGEATGCAAVAWDDLSSRLSELISSDLPPSTRAQLLRILRRAATAAPQVAEAITPIVPHAVKALVLRPAWPSEMPNIDALRLLRETIESSREAAEALRPTAEALLKFLATDIPISGKEVVLEVLRILYGLGRYGMGASLAASAREVWSRLATWISTEGGEVYVAYFDLLRVWVVCAIDPHRTTPEHDLTWSQLCALGIVDEATSALRTLLAVEKEWTKIAAVLAVLAEYALGASINGQRGGEGEKDALLSSLQEMDLLGAIPTSVADIPQDGGFNAALAQVFHLNNALDFKLVVGPPLQRLVCWTLSTAGRGDVELRHAVLTTAKRVVDLGMWARSAFDLALNFGPGDEPLALSLVDDIIRTDWAALADLEHHHEEGDEPIQPVLNAIKSIGHADGLTILRPLLHATILPALADILAPRPSHLYLKATGTLRPPPPNLPQALPLLQDWVFSPLDELLRSGASQALDLAPGDWDASEPQLVRATLALSRLAHLTSPSYRNRTDAILGAMKVFMLEHGLPDAPNSVKDVFRDDAVSSSLTAILDTTAIPSSGEVVPAPLESAARFLGETPFFQFYQDLVALYEAVSFGDHNFSEVLLPPLAMNYPVDYRRLLWAESGALRSLRIDTGVPLECGTISTYFTPLETDRGVLHSYARALVAGKEGFLGRVAMHHLAGMLWKGTDTERTSPRVQLLVVVLAQGSDAVLHRVIAHDVEGEDGTGTVGEGEVKRRVAAAAQLGGPRAVSRLKAAGYEI